MSTDEIDEIPHWPELELAAQLLAAAPESVERVLARHRRRPDGCCTGCGPTLTDWPCFVGRAAQAARRRAP